MAKRKAGLKAGGGPVIPRAGGGVIIPRAGGGVVILRAGGGPIIPRSGRRQVSGGWQPDIPDCRDHALDTEEFEQPLRQANARLASVPKAKAPSRMDNRQYCSPIENQDTLGSCTAHAVVGMLEYMMRRGLGEHTDLSSLFLYKVTRRLLGWTGDTGAYLRTTIKAAACFGVPPEEHCPYDISRYEQEPDAFLYSYANNFKALKYARLDPYNSTGAHTLDSVKRTLAAGFVVSFGFPVYNAMTESPYVPYPTSKDTLQGGHAVLAVGYDDNIEVEDPLGKKTSEGCLIFRNSWGEDWGVDGYGYLPYEYVENGLAVDFWTVYRSEWLADGMFS
ncbi:C1 family peptidase [Nitrospira sp. Nam80]